MVMETTEQQYAFDMIARTRTSCFLTGKAGTGKTTFLKNVQAEIEKNFAVVAPTGVAALNAGGQTIHSFFGIGLGVQTSDETGSVSKAKQDVMMNVDSIIVDEVSMVRCDIIDTMDRTLRYVRKNTLPFGGVQMIFVGDLFQLPPVVKNIDKEIKFLFEENTQTLQKVRFTTRTHLCHHFQGHAKMKMLSEEFSYG